MLFLQKKVHHATLLIRLDNYIVVYTGNVVFRVLGRGLGITSFDAERLIEITGKKNERKELRDIFPTFTKEEGGE